MLLLEPFWRTRIINILNCACNIISWIIASFDSLTIKSYEKDRLRIWISITIQLIAISYKLSYVENTFQFLFWFLIFSQYEDIVQLEWLSNFVEDSFSGGGMTLEKGNTSITKALSHNHFHTSSPVLESSSSSTSSSGGKKMLPVSPTQRGPHRARSKRPRPAAFNPRPAIQLASPTSSEFENFASAHPVNKKKKMKVWLPPVRVEANPNPNPSQGVRKCRNVCIAR